MWIILISDTWSQREKILKTMAILCSIAIFKKNQQLRFQLTVDLKKIIIISCQPFELYDSNIWILNTQYY